MSFSGGLRADILEKKLFDIKCFEVKWNVSKRVIDKATIQ